MGSDPPHHQLASSVVAPDVSSTSNTQEVQPLPDSPEPLSEEDLIRMRNRILDMGLYSDNKSSNHAIPGSPTLREKELGGMVVKLLDTFVHPTQLHRQAEFISWLGTQRDVLVQSFEEERRRWEAEREGWNRMAEALLAQRARAANSSQRDEELERQCASYESENKSLREKLQDSHSRFSALESELSKLKPLLLMQPPYPVTVSLSERLSTFQTERPTELGSSRAKRRVVDSPLVEEPELQDSATTPTHIKPSQLHLSSNLNPNRNQHLSDYYKRHSQSTVPSPLHSRHSAQSTPTRSIFSATQTPSTQYHPSKKLRLKHKKFLSSNLLPLTADARIEHLLLAARKIGKERASAISGLMRRIEKEKEVMAREREVERLDQERLDRTAAGITGSNAYYRTDPSDTRTSPALSAVAAIPKTPKRGQVTTHFLTPALMTPRSDLHQPNNQTANSFAFVGAPSMASHKSTARPSGHSASTTQSTMKPAQTPQTAPPTSSSHPTPLASLLSAAKSMMDDESIESSATPSGRRRSGVLDPPESPLRKRRKVGNGSGNLAKGKGSVDVLEMTSTPGPDRVRSALDVLADQAAAAFDSDWQSPTKLPTKLVPKNEGKDKVLTSAHSDVFLEDNGSTPRAKPGAARDTRSGNSTGRPMSTRNQSKKFLTDRLPKETTKASRNSKLDKSVGLKKRSTRAPRSIYSPETRSHPSLSPIRSPTPPLIVSKDTINTSSGPQCEERPTSDEDELPLQGNVVPRPSKSPIDDCRVLPGPFFPGMVDKSLALNPHDAIALGTVFEDTERLADNVIAENQPMMTSVAKSNETHDPHGGTNSSVLDHPDGKETEDISGRVGAQAHVAHGFISDGDGPDTDADAEGEVDVDAEETIIMHSSSMTNDALHL